jgi:glycosyltransferase involved in cell wall biosynthesis
MVMGVSCFDGMASSTRVRNLFAPLIEKKLIVANNLVYQTDTRELVEKKGNINNINYRVIGFKLSNVFSIFSFWAGGISFLRKSKLKGYKNIIYNYNYPDLKNIVILLFGKMMGYKIIFDIIEDNRFESHVSFINKLRLKTSLVLFKISRWFTGAYVAISDHLYKRAELIAKGKVPVYLVPITVNLNYFEKINYEPGKELKIFYGGSFGAKDGLEYLISAFDAISKADPNIKLILTGLGNKQDLEKIQTQINQSAGKERIIYLGFLSSADYYKTLNDCDIFCMTRINSQFANAGFPFKLGEFLASGKGVIATKVGDVSNYLNDTNALLISPNSVSELTAALLTFIKDPGKIKSLGAEARRTAEAHFDSEQVSIKLLSIFESA